MTNLLPASGSPTVAKQQPKTRPARRKRRTADDIPTASSDRRKRPARNSPQVQSETDHPNAQPSSPPSEFIKFLPVDSLIRYLDHHYLLKSPIQSDPTSPSSSSKKTEESRLIDAYNQFALLGSSNLCNTNILQDPDHQLGNSSRAKKSTLSKEENPPALISPSACTAQASSRSEFTFASSSLASFYDKLFSASSNFLTGLDLHHSENESNKKSELDLHRQNSLFKFDQTLLNLVLNHHHQSFPTLIVEPTDDSISYNKCSPVKYPTNRFKLLPSSPSSSHSSVVNSIDRVNQKTAVTTELKEEDTRKNGKTTKKLAEAYPHQEKLEKTTTKKSNSMTFDQHGFEFKIYTSDPPANNSHVVNNHQKIACPDRHLEMIENHVLSHFVYSVKTRGNALRPK